MPALAKCFIHSYAYILPFTKFHRALRFWLNHSKAIAWRTWVSFVDWRKEKKKIISKWMFPFKV